jgi:hypothetical protein
LGSCWRVAAAQPGLIVLKSGLPKRTFSISLRRAALSARRGCLVRKPFGGCRGSICEPLCLGVVQPLGRNVPVILKDQLGGLQRTSRSHRVENPPAALTLGQLNMSDFHEVSRAQAPGRQVYTSPAPDQEVATEYTFLKRRSSESSWRRGRSRKGTARRLAIASQASRHCWRIRFGHRPLSRRTWSPIPERSAPGVDFPTCKPVDCPQE